MSQVQEESLPRTLAGAEYIPEVTLNAGAKIVAWVRILSMH
jgi:hypothetical protein